MAWCLEAAREKRGSMHGDWFLYLWKTQPTCMLHGLHWHNFSFCTHCFCHAFPWAWLHGSPSTWLPRTQSWGLNIYYIYKFRVMITSAWVAKYQGHDSDCWLLNTPMMWFCQYCMYMHAKKIIHVPLGIADAVEYTFWLVCKRFPFCGNICGGWKYCPSMVWTLNSAMRINIPPAM